jgi:hypothetical protein
MAILSLSASAVGCGGSVSSGTSPTDAGATTDAGAPRDSGSSPAPDSGAALDSGPADDANPAPDAAADASNVCALDPPGTKFVFHVHNAGTRMLAIALGCGGSLPITVQTSQGMVPIGPGPENQCEFTCDVVYGTMGGGIGCSDCGPGVGSSLAPGMTVDIAWDRRGYQEITPDPLCTGGAPAACAFGTTIGPTASQAGVLTVCTGTPLAEGYCATTDTVMFSIDTTQKEGTIQVP